MCDVTLLLWLVRRGDPVSNRLTSTISLAPKPSLVTSSLSNHTPLRTSSPNRSSVLSRSPEGVMVNHNSAAAAVALPLSDLLRELNSVVDPIRGPCVVGLDRSWFRIAE